MEQMKVLGPERGPQVKQTALLASPIYKGQARGGGNKCIKGGNLEGLRPLFSCLLGHPAFTPQGVVSLFFLIKLSYNTTLSITSSFCCSETEPRKLHIYGAVIQI